MLEYRHKNKSLRVKKGKQNENKRVIFGLNGYIIVWGSSAFAKSSSLENIVNNNNSTSSNVRTINNISNNDKNGNSPSSMILSPNTGLYPANTNIIIISFLGIISLVGLFIKRQIAKIKIKF